MPAHPQRADDRGDHLIVCGDGPLSYRITEELTSRYGERVTVILPDRRHNHGPQISALPRVRMLEYPELSSQAFTDADVQSARALAVVWQDDVGNLHAGLRAQELNPGLRLVLAIFNRRLGEHIRMLFPDCTVLSGTAMSAPSFVAAALGEPAPSHVRVQRRTLYVARPDDVAAGAVVCGLTDDHDGPQLLPPGERPPGPGRPGAGRCGRDTAQPAGPPAQPGPGAGRAAAAAGAAQVRPGLRGAAGGDLRRVRAAGHPLLGEQRAVPGAHGPDRVRAHQPGGQRGGEDRAGDC